MTRSAFFLILGLVAIVVIGTLSGATNPGGQSDQSIENTLAVQKATLLARDYLQASEPKKAVDVLEANLRRVQGDRKYLSLLRDAYRSYIKDLSLAQQTELAELYQKRLALLDDQEMQPRMAAGPSRAAPNYLFQMPTAFTYARPRRPVTFAPVVARAKPDPFDPVNEIKFARSDVPQQLNAAKSLMAKAEEEFSQKHYSAAKLLYEQAYNTDPKAMNDEGRGRWAYCQLQLVVDQINRFPDQPCDWNSLEKDVKIAMMAAPHLSQTADMILGEMSKRRGPSPTVRTAMPRVVVKHKPRGDHGWLIAESANFRIFHNQTPEFAESVAEMAETTRSQMSRKWFGKEPEDWNPKCDIYLHANAADYSQHTGQNSASPGHSRIDLDPNAGRVVVRQVHLRCDNPTILNAILPHETTHVVLAGQFGNNHHVPRWIDEGVAVLTEPAEKIQQHRINLIKGLQNKTLIPLPDLMQMDSYPAPAQIATFYGQSVALVDFLAKQKGPVVLMQFAREALQGGYEPALSKYYGYQTFVELQTRFTERILAEANMVQPTTPER